MLAALIRASKAILASDFVFGGNRAMDECGLAVKSIQLKAAYGSQQLLNLAAPKPFYLLRTIDNQDSLT